VTARERVVTVVPIRGRPKGRPRTPRVAPPSGFDPIAFGAGLGSFTVVLRIDGAAECIWRDGDKVTVPPKAFLVLRCLLARPGQLVTKDELLAAAWPDTFVTEKVLNNAIAQLRQALGDDPKRSRFIETAHRRGFRWIGPAAAAAPPAMSELTSLAAVDREGAAGVAFVGRADSLAELGRLYARAAAGQRQVVLVGGDPGIGKTALVDRFVDRLSDDATRAAASYVVARGQCIEGYGAGDLYRPLREAVEQLWRDGGDTTRAAFRTHAPSWLLSMPELSSPEELEHLRRTRTATTIDSVQRELERALEAASVDRTLVLVLEDLHWSEPATVALVGALAARRGPARLMVIATYRPVEAIAQQHPIIRLKRELAARRQCVELALEGLPSDQVAAFLDRQFPQHELPSAFAARLHEQTTGNPLFLLNALADFGRRGWLREEEHVWRCTADLEAIFAAVPESTRELIAFRLDQLPATTRALLQAGSIVGTSFATLTVAAATERDPIEVEIELESLARSEFAVRRGRDVEWPDGRRGCEYDFRHALYRQVLLSGITPARRQDLHRRIAQTLEAGYGERADEIAATLSLHHEAAGDALRAVDYIDILVQQAYARSVVHEAEPLLGHAVELLKRTHTSAAPQPRLLKLAIAHGIALSATRGTTSVESVRALQQARTLGQSMPTSLEHIASMGTMVGGSIIRGQLREARALAEEMLAVTGADASPRARVTAYASAGSTLLYVGEIDAALREMERAVAAIDTISDAEPAMAGFEPVIPAHVFRGFALIIAGRLERGRAAIDSALQVARTTDMPWYLGFALNIASAMAMVRRDVAATRQLAGAVLAYGVETNLPLWKVPNQVLLGWSEILERGDAGHIAALRQRVDRFRASGNVAASHTYAVLTDACLSVGRFDDAASALDAAFDSRGEERLWDAELCRLRGAVWRGRAQASPSNHRARGEAEQCFAQAIEIASAQGARLFGLRATADLCRLWHAAGKRDQAHAGLSEALGKFDEGFGETDLREARTLLDEIESGSRPAPTPRK
jgi:DNA-binding winged helix-turn-helix (wHTH) protein/tetratricopeptide (TPR) repeat protein